MLFLFLFLLRENGNGHQRLQGAQLTLILRELKLTLKTLLGKQNTAIVFVCVVVVVVVVVVFGFLVLDLEGKRDGISLIKIHQEN